MDETKPTDDADAPGLPDWPGEGAFESRSGFTQAVRGVLGQASARGVRRMWWLSPDWADWPLGDAAAIEALTAWVRGGPVELVWLASDFDRLERHLPRLARWRREWAHRVRCLAPDPQLALAVPNLLLADDICLVRVFDERHLRGRVSHDGREIRQTHEWLDALLQRSVDTYPVTSLGL